MHVLATTWSHLLNGGGPVYVCYNTKTYKAFTGNTGGGLNPVTFRQGGDRSLFFLLYCHPQKCLCCLLLGAEIGYWVKACACTFFMYIFTCVHTASMRLKRRGTFNPWLARLLGNSWSQALCHATTTPTLLTKGALSCNRGNLSTSLFRSCWLWNTMRAI